MDDKFYITTAINYTNGSPHLGHAYEIIIADCIARYHRAMRRDVFFLTGSDEHGQKIEETATSQKLLPVELCDKYVLEFQKMNAKLSVSNNSYIRTTDPKHESMAKLLWKKVAASGDIYLGEYKGWYSKREERFLTETEASAANYMDGSKPLTMTTEPSYFFRLSRYQTLLVEYIQAHPDFIFPAESRISILERLKEPLQDLSISRTSFSWGISIPQSFDGKGVSDPDHVMYVWFDALANYLSGIEWPLGENSKFWPANVHLIGKDIVWFHAVIWPCILFSAGLDIPRQIVCHGMINDPAGKKMSKSWGNVMDPMELLKNYPRDVIRYFLLRDGSFGSDFSFNVDILRTRHDSELAANVGNLAMRTFSMVDIYCGNQIPVEDVTSPLFSIEDLSNEIERKMVKFQIESAIMLIFSKFSILNEWLTKEAPWLLKGQDAVTKRNRIVRTLLEGLYILSHFLEPFMPSTASRIFGMIRKSKTYIPRMVKLGEWKFLTPCTKLKLAENKPLFPRLERTRFDKKNKKDANW